MKPTEMTMRDVLHQGVADAIRAIKQFKEYPSEPGEKGPITTSIKCPTSLEAHLTAPGNSIRFTMTSPVWIETDKEMYHRTPLTSLMAAGYTITLEIKSVVAQHRAVWNALCDLLPSYPTPQDLPHLVWDEFPQTLVYRTGMLPDPPATGDSQFIPQLATYAPRLAFYTDTTACMAHTHSILAPLWRVREQERLRQGLYLPLPDDYLKLLPQQVIDDQYPHLATKGSNAGMVAYTQSPLAGALDRQQVQKSGRYIRQHRPDLTHEQVKQAAATVLGAIAADFYHTKDPDEIHRVYMEGPQSCMTAEGRFDHLRVNGEPYHPAMIYAHPENHIELVFLEVNDRIGARVLVNTKKKTYPRIYSGDSVAGAGRRMGAYLESLGYRHSNSALAGEKLLLVSPDDNPDAIICPYIDNANMGVEIYDDYLEADGPEDADYETGCLTNYNTWKSNNDWQCSCCDDWYSEDDDRYLDRHGDCICDNCISDYVEAWDPRSEMTVYVYQGDAGLYNAEYTRSARYADYLYLGRSSPEEYGFRLLTADYYSSGYDGVLAPERYCIPYHYDDYVLKDNLDVFDLVDVDGTAYPIDECIVLDDELRHYPNFAPDDEGARLIGPPIYTGYPQLDHYMTVAESATEEAV